jgi:hypothetical protein
LTLTDAAVDTDGLLAVTNDFVITVAAAQASMAMAASAFRQTGQRLEH